MAAHKKTHCVRGHERTPDNIIGHNRSCRVCNNENRVKRYAATNEYIKKGRKTHCKKGHERSTDNILGYNRSCRICKKERSAKWRADNPDEIKKWRADNPERHLDSYLKRIFGVSLEEYNKMLAYQDGVCAICGKPETAKRSREKTWRLSVDHCHKTGKVRGLLCSNCNGGIGKLKDDLSLVRKAAEYLANYQEEQP